MLGAKDNKIRLYKAVVPGSSKFALGRQHVDLLMVPPHEDLMNEVDDTPHLQNMNVGKEITKQEWVTRGKFVTIENSHVSITILTISGHICTVYCLHYL